MITYDHRIMFNVRYDIRRRRSASGSESWTASRSIATTKFGRQTRPICDESDTRYARAHRHIRDRSATSRQLPPLPPTPCVSTAAAASRATTPQCFFRFRKVRLFIENASNKLEIRIKSRPHDNGKKIWQKMPTVLFFFDNAILLRKR